MVQAATKRKRQNYADWIYLISHSALNENWKEVYDLMLGEKKEKVKKEKTPEEIAILFGQALGGARGMVKK
jgi:hypothetical protein